MREKSLLAVLAAPFEKGLNRHKLAVEIPQIKKYLLSSFPLKISQPFSVHSFQDILMKITRTIAKDNKASIILLWNELLEELQGKTFYNDDQKIVLDTILAREVLRGIEPRLELKLYEDFTAITDIESEEMDKISMESFWHAGFIYKSDPYMSAKKDTGIIVVKDREKIVALLQFKNHFTTEKTLILIQKTI